MEEFDNEALDTALTLEEGLKERCRSIVTPIAYQLVRAEVASALKDEKQAMAMEIAITVGKILAASEKEGRKPLWETQITTTQPNLLLNTRRKTCPT